MDVSINAPQKCANTKSEWVWFEGNGSSEQSMLKGRGVCYNWDYGTAASVDARRYNRVELPTILNAPYFAGVLSRDYTIPAGGTLVEISKPGSTCEVLSKASTTIGVGRFTCEAGGTYAGYFRYAGFPGQGSAKPLQTIDRSSTAGLCLAHLEEGDQSGLVEVVTPAAGAITCMVGGVTYLAAATIGSNATFTLADGTIPGQRKAFHALGTMTTSNVVITVTSGLQNDGATALATITFTGACSTHESVLEWSGFGAGSVWVEVATYGVTDG